jgi:hypothetical protein
LSEAKAKTDWNGEGGPLSPRATARQATLFQLQSRRGSRFQPKHRKQPHAK